VNRNKPNLIEGTMPYGSLYAYDEEDYYFHDNNERFLAAAPYDPYAKEEEPLDYSVLSVGVMTLGLLLFVEIGRHQLDHWAIGRPLFLAILAEVNSECK
jgi:hypothetical protein